jgi:hypothetical protein
MVRSVGSSGEWGQMRECFCDRLNDGLGFRQVVQNGVLVDVSGLAGILGLMAGHPDPVDRAQDGARRRAELRLHAVHNRQVPARCRGAEPLDLQPHGQGLPDRVVDGHVREIGVGVGQQPRAGQMLAGR